MKVVAIVLALLAVVVIAIVIFRALGPQQETGDIASYNDIKDRIRSGRVESNQVIQPPESEPPMPLDEIFKLKDSNKFVMALFDSITHNMAKNSGRELKDSESAIVHVYGLEAEVNNGGLDQYFFNSAGNNAAEALAGLDLIGAERMADILRRAIALFGDGGPSRDREKRWKQTDDWNEAKKAKLGELSNEFQNYPNPIADLMMIYCLAHKEDFKD